MKTVTEIPYDMLRYNVALQFGSSGKSCLVTRPNCLRARDSLPDIIERRLVFNFVAQCLLEDAGTAPRSVTMETVVR